MFDKEINLFELTEKVVERFRSESRLQLTGYEFEFKIRRDWNCPINRINIEFYLFGEEYTHTCFDENYDTVDKVIALLSKKQEKNSTLLITQSVFLILVIGLWTLEVVGNVDLRMMIFFQMIVVIILMKAIILNAERNLKRRYANNV